MNLREIHAVVAIRTFIGGFGMLKVFALGDAAIVATEAGGGCSLEDATLVAGFAGDLDMHAFQGKARCLMVEVLVHLESGGGNGWRCLGRR